MAHTLLIRKFRMKFNAPRCTELARGRTSPERENQTNPVETMRRPIPGPVVEPSAELSGRIVSI
tara:strand:- start:1375 stop:1566 length:192 start_codon:yes stop_codon:yes gene_type:complete